MSKNISLGKVFEYGYIPLSVIFLSIFYFFYLGGGLNLQLFVPLSFAIVVLIEVYLYLNHRFNYKTLLTGIIALGILLRIEYMLFAPIDQFGYDTDNYTLNGLGHDSYILVLVKTHALPQDYHGEFYQQPVFYILGAIIASVFDSIFHFADWFYLADSTKIVCCVASFVTLKHIKGILDDLKVEDKNQIFPMVIASFLPSMVFTAGRVTPDSLTLMFMVLVFRYTLKWHDDPSWKNTILLALYFGFGVSTKISVGVLAFATIIVFLLMLKKRYIDKVDSLSKNPIFIKLVVFGFISLPLGLWYSIRNLVKMGQPLTYVWELDKSLRIYMGDKSLFDRFINVNYNDFFHTPFLDNKLDCNFFAYAFKSSIFGHFVYIMPIVFPYAIFLVSLGILGLIIWSVTRYMVKDRFKDFKCNLLLFISGVLFISYLWFYYKYPFTCSADYRYMMFFILLPTIFCSKHVSDSKTYRIVTNVASVLYVLASVAFIAMITTGAVWSKLSYLA